MITFSVSDLDFLMKTSDFWLFYRVTEKFSFNVFFYLSFKIRIDYYNNQFYEHLLDINHCHPIKFKRL